MVLLLLAFLGGTLTILSPCVLPVIPFVFAQSNRPFRHGGDVRGRGIRRWAPCSGPVLGLILTSAALSGSVCALTVMSPWTIMVPTSAATGAARLPDSDCTSSFANKGRIRIGRSRLSFSMRECRRMRPRLAERSS